MPAEFSTRVASLFNRMGRVAPNPIGPECCRAIQPRRGVDAVVGGAHSGDCVAMQGRLRMNFPPTLVSGDAWPIALRLGEWF